MATDFRGAYEESAILTADPCRLVVLLYRAAVDAVGEARRHLAAGEIRERSEAITRACEIVAELALGVDHSKGGEISRNLVELYDYIQRLLAQANAEQADAPLAEAEQLLKTLLDAWEQVEAAAALPGPGNEAAAVQPEAYAPVNVTG